MSILKEGSKALMRGVAERPFPRSGGEAVVAAPLWEGWDDLFADFDTLPQLLVLPATDDEPAGEGVVEVAVGGELTAYWQRAGERIGVCVEAMIAGAWGIVVSRYLRTNDVAFQTLWKQSPGEAATRFPMRCRLGESEKVADLLLATEARMQAGMRLVKSGEAPAELAGVETAVLFDSVGTAKAADLGKGTLGLAVDARRDEMRLFYRDVLPSKGTAERLLEQFFFVLEQLSKRNAGLVSDVRLIDVEKWKAESRYGNRRVGDFPAKTLHDGLAAVVSMRPDAVAAQCGSQVLSYAELDAYAGRLAFRLTECGAGPGERVTIVMERSFEFLVALLAVLKTGASYVPIDSQVPAERMRQIHRRSGACLVLQRGGGDGAFGRDVRTVQVDLRRLTEGGQVHYAGTSADCAYVMFTSGSSGEPKGVAVSHGSASNEARACALAWELKGDDVALQFASPGFDVSVEEIWTTWLSGGRLIVQDEAALASFHSFTDWVRLRGITVLNLPSAFWHSLVIAMVRGEAELPVGVRLVIAGGEEVSAALYEQWRTLVPAATRFVNAYGPTEAAVTSTMFRDWCDARGFASRVPIGHPIANVTHYAVDQFGNPQPQGVPGELWIAGAGVATGYVDDAELTAACFIADPYGRDGARCYRTGDLVFTDSIGSYYYLGRSDRQIKVRGHRIEPGEVEAALREHPDVRDAFFCRREGDGGGTLLCAWVTPADDCWPSESALRDWLAQRLPSWMLPQSFVVLERLPLTPSGKIDASALPSKKHQPLKRGELSKPDERQLSALWREVIGTAPTSREQTFFELGGDSISVLTLIDRIREHFHVRLGISMLYANPSLGAMIDRIRERARCGADLTESDWQALVEIQPGDPAQSPLFLVHGIGGGILWGYRNLAERLPDDVPVIAFSSRATDGLPEFDTLGQMVDRYLVDMRRRQPVGPYRLGGYCLGGNIAFEMACRLEAAGEEVELLLFDAYPFLESEGRLRLRSVREWLGFFRNIGRKVGNLTDMRKGERLKNLARMGRWGKKWLRDRFFQSSAHEGAAATLTDIRQYTPEQLALWEHHLGLFAGYRSAIFGGHACLLRTRSQPLYSIYRDDLGWSEVVRGGVDVVILPGHHESVFREPDVAETASAVVVAMEISNGGRRTP